MSAKGQAAQADAIQRQASTRWTPPFIVFCAIFSGFGLGMACLLSFIWSNSTFINGTRLFMLYAGLNLLCWLLTIVKGRTIIVRLGSISGGLGALFTIISLWLGSHGITADSSAITQLHLVIGCTLLATSICFSFTHTRLGRWDTFLSWAIPCSIIAYTALNFVHHAPDIPVILYIEEKLVTFSLIISLIVWWLRPVNWKTQPGLTFLFGIIVILQYYSFHSNPLAGSQLAGSENAFFFQQIQFLCIMLSALRIYQAEKPRSEKKKVPQTAVSEEIA